MKKLLIILVMIVLSIALLAGCASEDDSGGVPVLTESTDSAVSTGVTSASPPVTDSASPDAPDTALSGAEEATGSVAAPQSVPDGDVIEIRERFFVTQVEDILLNASRYLGRTIRYEGIFRSFEWPPTGETIYFVMRLTRGCCSEEPIGFEVYLDDSIERPDDDTWVEVTGELKRHEGTLMIRVVSLIEPDERGAALVF